MRSSIEDGKCYAGMRADPLDVHDQVIDDGTEAGRRLDVGAVGNKTHGCFP